MSARAQVTTIDEYLSLHSPDVVARLQALREIIRQEAPNATEKISYAIPTFFLNGNLVHFAAFKEHVGFYPGADGIEAFKAELEPYHSAKGSVQFPLTEPLPEALIRRMVRYRVEINSKKAPSRKRGG